MAYKLYINNKLFNGIGNNNYNKGTIVINGTTYQFDNSATSSIEYLYKVSGVYNNPNGYVNLIENDNYINYFRYIHLTSQLAQQNSTITNTSTQNSDILFNGYAGGQGRNRAQSFGSDNSRYFIINPKYDGKILFYYKIGSGSSAMTSSYTGNTATIVLCELQNYSFGDNPSNKILSSTVDTVISSFDASTVYESGEFIVNKDTSYLIYLNGSSTTPRLLIAGFKFVTD